jgi:hypothetical protein
MADKNILEQMLGHLVNDDKQKAEELFHEYVVAKSREIYETLIEAEMTDEEDDEEVDEAADDEDAEEDKVDENFEDIAYEGDVRAGGFIVIKNESSDPSSRISTSRSGIKTQ